MSCKWPNEPACKRVRLSNLLNGVIIFDGTTPPVVDIDDLVMATIDLLDQYRKRGMDDSVERSIVKQTFEADNIEKLKGLIAKFEAAIQAHDAEVAAARAALGAPEFADMDHMDAPFSSFPIFHHFHHTYLLPVEPKATPKEPKATPTRFCN
jgi:hypothetical protein